MRNAEAGDLAGITGYYDERSFFLFGLEKTEKGCALRLIEQIGGRRAEKTFCQVPSPEAALLIRAEGLLRTLCVQEKDECRPIASIRTEYLCDEGVTGGKRFTGALCGLAAVGRGTASFRSFSYHSILK